MSGSTFCLVRKFTFLLCCLRVMPDSAPPASRPLNEVQFSERIAAITPALRGYLLSLLLRHDAVEDAFQETLLFLWEKRATFDPATNFRAWAFKTAYFKALAKRRDLQREKAVCYPEEMLQTIAIEAEAKADEADPRMTALQTCLQDVAPADRTLLQMKYLGRGTVTTFAKSQQASPNKFHKALSRLRLRLKNCIEKRLRLSA